MNVADSFKVIGDYLCIRMPKEIDHHNAQCFSEQADYFICHKKISHIVFDFADTEASYVKEILSYYQRKVNRLG